MSEPEGAPRFSGEFRTDRGRLETPEGKTPPQGHNRSPGKAQGHERVKAHTASSKPPDYLQFTDCSRNVLHAPQNNPAGL